MRNDHVSPQTFHLKQQLDPSQILGNYRSLVHTSRQLSQNPLAVDQDLFKNYDLSSIVNQKPSNEQRDNN